MEIRKGMMIPDFRAWEIDRENMLHEFGFGTEELAKQGINETLKSYIEHDNWVLMQGMGLLDCEGERIFEGDILEKEGARIIIKREEWVGFFAECIDEDHPNWCEDWIRDFYRISDFKVIGNKFENPELCTE